VLARKDLLGLLGLKVQLGPLDQLGLKVLPDQKVYKARKAWPRKWAT
jgi:hypothetical protein